MNNFLLWKMFSSIKNAHMTKKPTILQKKSKICSLFLIILWDEGYITGFRDFPFSDKYYEIFLKYDSYGYSNIKHIISLSRPGKRVYYTVKQLWKIKITTNLIILTTSRGILTINKCKEYKIGGQPLLLIN